MHQIIIITSVKVKNTMNQSIVVVGYVYEHNYFAITVTKLMQLIIKYNTHD